MRRGPRKSAVFAALGLVRRGAPREVDPRVVAEHHRTLLARAVASCWVAIGIIPFTILTYDGAFFREQLGKGALDAGVAVALIGVILVGLRRHAFDRAPWLPFALLAGVICNGAEAVNLVLTGGPVESDFVFPYYVVSFGISILFPAPLVIVVCTAALLPLGYVIVAVATEDVLTANRFVSNLMLLVDSACITCIGNVVVTNLFLREVKLRLDLESANQRLRELDRLKSEFFANVSHELRTPLTLILAPAASLARDGGTALDAAQRSLVDTIRRNATRLLQLINDLLLLAKLESGEPTIHRVPVDIAAAVRRVVQEAEAYAKSLDLRLEVSIGNEPLVWSGDERHFERILLNLVSNACKFSRPAGVVRVEAQSERDGIHLKVIDQGIGIAPQDVDKIFERFVQVESSASRRFEGTGIGLSIVKQLVTLHGGRISVDSEPNRGSTFHVILSAEPRIVSAGRPSSSDQLAKVSLQPAVAAPVPSTRLDGPRVAVVEDNTDLLAYLTQELGRTYRIVPHQDSVAALGALLEDPPDLIVSDIMMPGLDGIALATRLRKDPRTSEVPVVLLSAREEVEAKLAGFDAGADDYVQKPFDVTELLARIELHLRLRSQARELRRALDQLKQAESSLVQSEKMVALGRMVAGVAHEMNNPLHFLRGNLSLLRREVPHSESTAPLLADIDESVERMTSVTRQLLLFGRKHGPGTEAVKLADVVPLVVRMMSPQVPAAVRIVQRVEGESVRANPQDLFQIITNIVHNAVQAFDPQTGGEVQISSGPRDGKVELRVADNGCGISRENLPRIFDPFFTTKPPGSGTGLGLSIVRELVTAQEGSLRVESEQGRGTTVAVLLHAGNA